MISRLFYICVIPIIFTNTISADEVSAKRGLNGSYIEIYHQTPKKADTLGDMFKEGMFYARLRSNSFSYKWEKENSTQQDYIASGLGGSLLYQSAIYNDFYFKTGLYYSHGFFSVKDNDISKLKAAKSILSRFEYSNTGSNDMAVLGQAYISYGGIKNSELKVGRQLVETFYARSNDIAMIPQTFDAAVFSTNAIPKTSVTLAYLLKQKLRGHITASSPLVYGDSNSSSSLNPQWSGNDDNAMHKGLTHTALKAAGKPTDAPLIVLDAQNNSIEDLKVNTAYYNVEKLVSQGMLEGNYKFDLSDNLFITSGARYIRQFDDGAGKVGGAAIDANADGYKNPDSLDSQMFMARVMAKYKNYNLKFAYSQVCDESDLISPWRGFLTSGYTFSLTRVNWLANQRSSQIELNINENPTGIYKDVLMKFYITYTDADENKGHYDEKYYYAGFTQNISLMQDLQWRIRVGYLDTKKIDADGLDTRFEINYLF